MIVQTRSNVQTRFTHQCEGKIKMIDGDFICNPLCREIIADHPLQIYQSFKSRCHIGYRVNFIPILALPLLEVTA
jgi:hypothetical protein